MLLHKRRVVHHKVHKTRSLGRACMSLFSRRDDASSRSVCVHSNRLADVVYENHLLDIEATQSGKRKRENLTQFRFDDEENRNSLSEISCIYVNSRRRRAHHETDDNSERLSSYDI